MELTERGKMRPVFAFLIATVSLGASGDECDKPSIAGGTIGMTIERAQSLVVNANLRIENGTRILTGTPKSVPSGFSGAGLQVNFDETGRAKNVVLRVYSELDEQAIIQFAESIWGSGESVERSERSDDLGHIRLVQAVWAQRCGAEPRLGVRIQGKAMVHLTLLSP